MGTLKTCACAAIFVSILVAGCNQAPLAHYWMGHMPTTNGDGTEYHICEGGGSCQEGYACVKDGCEWCGDGDGVATRCTEGSD